MKFADSVKQAANLTSTSTITPGAAATGFRTLAQAIADTAGKPEQVAVGDTLCMRVDDVTDPTKFEIAEYTIGGTASAPTLTRGTIDTSSAAGAAVTFGGAVTVLCTVPSNFLVGKTIGQMPAVAQSSITGTDVFELEQSGTSGKLSVDTLYAWLVAKMQAAGLFTGSGSTGGTGGTTPTETMSINAIASPQTVGTKFTVSGKWTGVQPTSLDHASTDNAGTQGAWTTLTSAANNLVINANGTWSYDWTPSNPSTSRTLQVRDTSHPTVLSAQSNSYVVNAAASSGVTYHVSRYDGGAIPLSATDVYSSTSPANGSYNYTAGTSGLNTSNVGYAAFAISPPPPQIASGWGASNSAPPSLVLNGADQRGDNVKQPNGFLAIQPPWNQSDSTHSNIVPPTFMWLPGVAGTYNYYYWVCAVDANGAVIPGSAVCVNPTNPWKVTVS